MTNLNIVSLDTFIKKAEENKTVRDGLKKHIMGYYDMLFHFSAENKNKKHVDKTRLFLTEMAKSFPAFYIQQEEDSEDDFSLVMGILVYNDNTHEASGDNVILLKELSKRFLN